MTRQVEFVGLTANIAGERRTPELEDALDRIDPDFAVITEGKRARAFLRGLDGYELHRFGRGHGREAPQLNLLTRRGLDVERVRLLKMDEPWVGPLRNRRHDGRRYMSLRGSKGGATLRVLGVHFPTANNPGAQRESERRVVQWFSPELPAVVLGDFNQLDRQVRAWLAPAGLRFVGGTKVDHAGSNDLVRHVETVRLQQIMPNRHGIHGWNAYRWMVPTNHKESR